MWLKRLDINRIRNIDYSQCEFGPGFNFIFGENGSGKSSLLESIHILSLGRSFRTREIKSCIMLGQEDCVISGLITQDNDQDIKLGLQRSRQGIVKLKVGEKEAHTLTDLAQKLAVQLINVDSTQLLEGGPKLRRQFLDWGVFHVEHDFLRAWQYFNRALIQRNKVLKGWGLQEASLHVWSEALLQPALSVDAYRRQYVEQYKSHLLQVYSELLEQRLPWVLDVHYKSGWNNAETYEEALRHSIGFDMRSKYTSQGPHRADLEVTVDGMAPKQLLSRGQLKLLTCAMFLARARMTEALALVKPILMIDDLSAELDRNACRVLLEYLQKEGGQVIVTGIHQDALRDSMPKHSGHRIYQISQGRVEAFRVERTFQEGINLSDRQVKVVA